MKVHIIIKGLLLSLLAFVAIGLNAQFKIVNSTDSAIQFKFADPGRDAVVNKLGRGGSWGASGDGPGKLSVAADSRVSRWRPIDTVKKHAQIDEERSQHKGDTVLWHIVPTTFGYDVDINWD